MIAGTLRICTLCLSFLPGAEPQPVPDVVVLDGPEVEHMRDGLKRVGCPFRSASSLDATMLSRCRVLVISGKEPPPQRADAKLIEEFLTGGGSVLGVGGGAGWMIRNRLFDAKSYFMTGTTIHMTAFNGYHRLTFGYPGAKPADGWTAGVPMLLRATEGPLMELGPQAVSILGCGGPFSAAAVQRVGKGLVLLIGPDPQGGNAYHSLEKPTLTRGDQLQTDRLLANALAYLKDPNGNIIPNAGFEENTDLPSAQSNWQITLQKGATTEWCQQDAPQGNVFLRIDCPQKQSRGVVEPYCPLVVERGSRYKVACLYKATVEWTLDFRFFKGQPPASTREHAEPVSVPPSGDWKRLEAVFTVPQDVSYAKPAATTQHAGQLCLDELTMQRSSDKSD